MRKLFYLLLGWLLLYCGELSAQTITVSTSSSPLVQCGAQQTFTVMIHNSASTPQTLSGIQVALPPCVRYVTGSLTGGNANVTFVSSTADSLAATLTTSLAANANLVLTMQLEAVCGTNCGSSVTNSVHVLYGNTSANSPPNYYNILTPSLSITNVSNQSVTANVGTTVTRCITLQSSGLNAPLSSVTLAIQSNPGSLNDTLFRVGTNGAQLPPVVTGNTNTLTIGSAAFQTVGDLDGAFENGESITICYDVQILDCINLASSITASWGCGGQTCQSQTVPANVTVPTALPHLLTSNSYTTNYCYGSSTPAVIKIILKNDQAGPARDVDVHVWEGVPAGFGFDFLSDFNTNTIQLRHSGGGGGPIAPYFVQGGPPTSCAIPGAKSRFKVKIPFIPGNSTDTLIVERYQCCKDTCAAGYIRGVYYDVQYQDQCLASNYSIQPTAVAGDNIGRVVSLYHSGPSNLSSTWGNYEIEHSDFRFFSMASTGYALVKFMVPSCMQVDMGANSIYFDYPASSTNWNPDNVTQLGQTITARFRFSSFWGYNSNLEKVMLKFRLRADCSCGACAAGPKVLSYKIYQVPNPSCTCEALIACYDLPVNTHCGICPTTCADGGMMFLDFTARRENYGPSDNNSDGIPDAISNLNFGVVRTQYLILRDTLITKFKGVVSTTSTNTVWEQGYARSLISDGTYLSPLSYNIRIRDNSTGQVHTGTSTYIKSSIVTGTNSKYFRFTLSPDSMTVNPPLPVGFKYAQGDSVEIEPWYRVDGNISGVVHESIINEFKMKRTAGFEAGCDTYRGDFTLVGYYYSSYGPNVLSLNGCDTLDVSESYYLSIGNCCHNYAGGDIFRGEYRYFACPANASLTLPNGFTCTRVTMDNSRTRGLFGQVYSAKRSIPFTVNANVVSANLSSHFGGTGADTIRYSDEGFYGTVTYTLKGGCAVTPNVSHLLPHRMDFNPIPAFTGAGSEPPYDADNDRVVYKAPTLSITPVLATVSGVSPTVSWTFDLRNTSNVANAGYVWFALQSPSGQVIPLQVQSGCSTNVSSVGGIYQVGTLLPGATRQYCVTASYVSCNLDSLRIIAGWDCNSYPANVNAYPCPTVKRSLFVDPAPTQMQASVTTASSSMGICDSMLVELTVASTLIGHVNGINLAVTLPLTGGLTYAPGSTMMLYPAGGAWTSVANPSVAGNELTWSVNALNSAINSGGLPGTLQPSANTFKLRFYVQSNCNMVSGDRIRFVVNGNRSCNAVLPTIVLLSAPILINGATTPYQSTVITSISNVSSCPLVKRITVSMVNNGPGATVAGDRIVVGFGNGYTYQSGFVAISNAPSNPNPTVNSGPGGSSFSWAVPAGVPSGATISFSFLIAIGNNAACGSDIATVQGLTNQTLFCVRTNSNCATSAVQTGASTLIINTQRPILSITNLGVTLQPIQGGSRYNYSLSLGNAGSTVSLGNTIPIRFYCDVDANCTFSSGDVLLFTVNHSSGLTNGGQVNLNGSSVVSGSPCPSGSQVLAMVDPNFCQCGSPKRCAMIILPVEWESISGEALPTENLVHWKATILPGHDHFVLEKAQESGWVDISAPIYGGDGSYTAPDAKPTQVEQYRVRAVDQDGRFTHSSIVEIVRDLDGFALQLYLNPARKSVTLQSPAECRFRIVDAIGQELLSGNLAAAVPQTVDISRLAAGIYQVEYSQRANGHVTRLRLVVQ